MKFKPTHKRSVRLIVLSLTLMMIWIGGPVAYYFLPWSFRKTIHNARPQLNRTLYSKGFKTMETWDSLGLWGKDCQTPIPTAQSSRHVYGGDPVSFRRPVEPILRLENDSYVVGYSEAMKNPLWVAYRVFQVPQLNSGKRPSSFRIDRRTQSKVKSRDYTRSGYDRGHMAPNHAIATRYGSHGQRETFLMSNIIPQVPRINRHMWKDLEWLVSRNYGRYFSEVWVLTGPIFPPSPKQLPSGIPIPTAYYKIIADEAHGKLRVMAFLIESTCPPYTRIKMRLVSVDEVEKETGLNFFPNLDSAAQAEIETHPAGRLWPWLPAALQQALPF